MPDKIYLHLFILCGIWLQGITGNVADEETRESSAIHVRQKRVINSVPGEDIPIAIGRVPYIVRIKLRARIHCAASILSHYVVITSATCADEHPLAYQVVSGKANLDSGTYHNVSDIKRHFGHHPRRPQDGIALVAVNPPFVYGFNTDYIKLHSGPLLQGTLGTITGWGYNSRSVDGYGTRHLRSLRSIEVPIIAHMDCVHRYEPRIQISDKDICTFHPEKHCGHNDGGAPLVIDGYLAGVHLWTRAPGEQNDPRFPDVFAILQHNEYNQFIRTNVENIVGRLQLHH